MLIQSTDNKQGRYKPMQHRVKHQFEDFVVQAALDGGHAQVFVVSDDVAPTTADLELAVYRLAAPAGAQCGCGGKDAKGGQKDDSQKCEAAAAPVWKKRVTVPVPALNSALVVNASVSELLAAMPGCAKDTCFLRATATAAATATKPAATSGADLFLAPFKDLQLAAPKVALGGFTQDAPDRVSFDVSTDGAAALLVVLDTPLRGRFSDNMLNLAPCQSVRVTFTGGRGARVSASELEAALTAEHVYEHQLDALPLARAAEELKALKRAGVEKAKAS